MKKLFIYIIFFFVLFSCKEKFNTKISSPPTGYLVVEGFISSGASPTSITLTRSVKLYDSVDIVAEHNAIVKIESETNELFPLTETGSGIYSSKSLSLDDTKKYHLQIRTQDNKEYISDFAKFKSTPDIDSISWTRDDNGVKIYVDTHDPSNNTRYYHWKFEETWEFHATYYSSIIYVRAPNYTPVAVDWRNALHDPDTTIFKCWNTFISTSINLGSSEKLSRDVIHLPLLNIEPASVKLSVLYSINLRQYALSHEAYSFFQKVKKNTESLGSIFDAQPSDLQGNIHCVTDPKEIVIGYIDISEEKIKRIYIKNDEVPGWGFSQHCVSTVVDNNPDSILKYGIGLSPTYPNTIGPFGSIVKFNATFNEDCIDCTLTGTNVRPSFWP